jgi:hypothetical protein
MHDHPAGKRRPSERIGGGHCDRRRQAFRLDKARQQTKLRRNAEGVNRTVKKSEPGKKTDAELPCKGKACQSSRLQGCTCIADQKDAKSVIAVGKHAAERH